MAGQRPFTDLRVVAVILSNDRPVGVVTLLVSGPNEVYSRAPDYERCDGNHGSVCGTKSSLLATFEFQCGENRGVQTSRNVRKEPVRVCRNRRVPIQPGGRRLNKYAMTWAYSVRLRWQRQPGVSLHGVRWPS